MRVGMQSWGTEGDIRPFLALGHGLAQRGHKVALSYTSLLGRDYGEEATALGISARTESADVRGRPGGFHAMVNWKLEQRWEAAAQLAAESDLLIAHFMSLPLMVAAVAKGRPLVLLDLFPRIPTAAAPPIWAPPLGPWLNRFVWWITLRGRDRYFRGLLERLCRYAGLPAMKYSDLAAYASAQLMAVSPLLLPLPADWPGNACLSGFFVPPASGEVTLPDPLQAFLDEGEPPLFVSFGSAPPKPGEAERLAAAARRAGCRCILQIGGEAAGRESREGRDGGLYYLDHHIPYRVLLPRCLAAIHQGGAGTTYAALAAGIPSVILAYWADQPFWGRLLARQGLGPRGLSRRRFRDAELDRAIAVVTGDKALRSRVEALGHRLREEDGVANALSFLQVRGILP